MKKSECSVHDTIELLVIVCAELAYILNVRFEDLLHDVCFAIGRLVARNKPRKRK
jgi:hypothetical protein